MVENSFPVILNLPKLLNMKKLLLTVCSCLLILHFVNGQLIERTKVASTQQPTNKYIEKYKTYKTIGWVFLGSGIGLIAGSGIVVATWAKQGYNGTSPVTAEALLLIVGPAAALSSIPFFILAKNNKKKARLSLKEEAVMLGNKLQFRSNYTALALTIPL